MFLEYWYIERVNAYSAAGVVVYKFHSLLGSVREECGGLMLVRSTPERALRVQALNTFVDIVLCSWARHFTLNSASLHPGV